MILTERGIETQRDICSTASRRCARRVSRDFSAHSFVVVVYSHGVSASVVIIAFVAMAERFAFDCCCDMLVFKGGSPSTVDFGLV